MPYARLESTLPSPTPPDHMRVVAGAWLREGAVLAALRPAGKALGGFWELPGGKVEAGESDEGALRRELEEELGVQLQVGPCFGEDLHPHDGGDGLHLIAMVVHDSPGPRQEPSCLEHEALAWVSLEEVGAMRWARGDRRLLADLLLHQGLDPSLAQELPC